MIIPRLKYPPVLLPGRFGNFTALNKFTANGRTKPQKGDCYQRCVHLRVAVFLEFLLFGMKITGQAVSKIGV